MKNIQLWTDGSCNNNHKHADSGIGGWAFLIIEDGQIIHEDLGYKRGTTSSRMEQTAVLKGLEQIREIYKGKIKIEVHSDSLYVVNCFREKWFMRWRETNFYGIKNEDLWKKIIKLYSIRRMKILFYHVKGHSGIEMNERVDYLAGEARKCLKEKIAKQSL